MYSPLFFSFLFIHIISLVVGFGSVILIDTFGLLWILKKVKLSFVTSVAQVTQRLIWLGWSGLVVSGIVMLVLKGYIDNLTWMKLFFVALLGLNGLYLHIIKKSSMHLGDSDEMPLLARFRITLASTVSQLGWWSAVIIGFLHRHVNHTIDWPRNPTLWIIGVFLVISTIAVIGENILRARQTFKSA